MDWDTLQPQAIQDIEQKIIDDLNARFDMKLDISPSSITGQIINTIALAVWNSQNNITYIFNNAYNINNVAGKELEMFFDVFRIPVPIATKTTVVCNCYGTANIVIPIGSIVANGITGDRYISVNSGIIGVSGFVAVTFEAEISGAVFADIGQIDVVISVVNGWTQVSNPSSTNTGRDALGDAELRQLFYRTMAYNSNGSIDSFTSALELFLSQNEDVLKFHTLSYQQYGYYITVNNTENPMDVDTDKEGTTIPARTINIIVDSPTYLHATKSQDRINELGTLLMQKISATTITADVTDEHYTAKITPNASLQEINYTFDIPTDINIYLDISLTTKIVDANLTNKIKEAMLYSFYIGTDLVPRWNLGEDIHPVYWRNHLSTKIPDFKDFVIKIYSEIEETATESLINNPVNYAYRLSSNHIFITIDNLL